MSDNIMQFFRKNLITKLLGVIFVLGSAAFTTTIQSQQRQIDSLKIQLEKKANKETEQAHFEDLKGDMETLKQMMLTLPQVKQKFDTTETQ